MLKRFLAIWISAPLILAGTFCLGLAIGSSSSSSRSFVEPTDPSNFSALGEFDPTYKIDAKYPLARSSRELQFIKPAISTCDLALKQGAVMDMQWVDEQTLKITKSQLFIAPLSIRKRAEWGTLIKSADGNWSPNNDGSDICDIRNRNQALIKSPESVVSLSMEHVINKLDDTAFVWHAHTQSADLSNETWSDLSDGIFKRVDFSPGYGGTIRFGLSDAEIKELEPYLAQW